MSDYDAYTIEEALAAYAAEAAQDHSERLTNPDMPQEPEYDPTPVYPVFHMTKWLPEGLQNSSGFIKLANFWQECAEQRLHERKTLRLRKVMYPDAAFSKYLSAGASDIGHPYESDLSDYAVSMLGLPRQLMQYRTVAGTDNWYKFISFFFGAEVRCTNLYTDNYRQFYAAPKGALVMDGGSWYKTTHIDLVVNIRQLRFNLKPRSNQTLYARVLELVNTYRPVTLVVHKLTLMEAISVPQQPATLYVGVKHQKQRLATTPLDTSFWSM